MKHFEILDFLENLFGFNFQQQKKFQTFLLSFLFAFLKFSSQHLKYCIIISLSHKKTWHDSALKYFITNYYFLIIFQASALKLCMKTNFHTFSLPDYEIYKRKSIIHPRALTLSYFYVFQYHLPTRV